MRNSNISSQDWRDIFSIGYACACANMVRDHGYRREVDDCFRANFMSISKMREIGVDEEDIKVLRPVVRSIRGRRKN